MTGERGHSYCGFMIENRNGQTAADETRSTRPVTAGATAYITPEFIRLPKPGTLCSHSGLSRSKMNELVLPSPVNNFKPPVKSVSLRNRGQVKAVRLISYDSLMTYLRSFLQDGGSHE
jgi:hypothetical protein